MIRRMIPSWFLVLEAETRRLCRERGVDYDNATVDEIAPIHAEAERRLGEPFYDLLAVLRAQYAKELEKRGERPWWT